MKVLVVGKGAREHALCWRFSQSQRVWGLFCASGNPGIGRTATQVDIAPTEIDPLARFAESQKIDLTVVGSENPLALGIVDEFERRGLPIFGPTKAAAQLESSKSFAKTLMREAGVSTAEWESFDDADAARHYVKERRRPLVVKADGLALGKGVTICDDTDSAFAAITDAMEKRCFGEAGARVVVEERLAGEELSFFALCNGENAISLGAVQDYKAAYDDDRGPNTGGMGAFCPVPTYDSQFDDRVMSQVVRPTLAAMAARGTPFKGVLFAGLMVNGDRIAVLEFNTRFGDPECEPLMMRFDGDLAETLLAVAEGRMGDVSFKLSPRSAASVVLASGGYPTEYKRGLPITGLEQIDGAQPSEVKVKWAMDKIRVKAFHAGTALRDGQLVTDGGRVLAVTAMAEKLERAVASAYEAASMVHFEGKQMRRDIARRALDSAAPSHLKRT
jgi:phosphoribosylamine--glycine ligase